MPAEAGQPRLIEDRYLHGTRLRLRRVEAESKVVYKLCQKVRPDETNPSTVAITNIYLSDAEYSALVQLPASVLRKTRRPWQVGHRVFAVDKFHGELAGLLLAEIELTEAASALALPAPIAREVTADERFSGGYLAHATAEQTAEVLTLARSEAG